MAKFLKNASGSDGTWRGQLIIAGAYYQIPLTEDSYWKSDSATIASIAAGDLIVARDDTGATDYLDAASGMIYFLDSDPTPRDTDNAPITRNKTTQTGWHYEPRSLDFFTATYDSLYNRKVNGIGIPDGDDYGDADLHFYDASGIELIRANYGSDALFQAALDSSCIKTVVNWQAVYDFDIIGGTLDILNPPTYPDRAYIWVVVAPDIPENLGGSVPYFAGGLPLHFFVNGKVIPFDGRGVKSFAYDPIYNSNKIAFTVKHEVGAKIGCNIILDHFKA